MAEKVKESDPIRIFIFAMSGVVVLLGLFLGYLVWSVKAYDDKINEATKKTNAQCDKLVATIRDLEVNRSRATQEKFRPDVALDYFYKQANEAGIPQDQVAVQDLGDASKGGAGYMEHGYRVKINTQISREQLARFLFNVEKNSAIIKASGVQMNLPNKAEDITDKWDVTLNFAYRTAVASAPR